MSDELCKIKSNEQNDLERPLVCVIAQTRAGQPGHEPRERVADDTRWTRKWNVHLKLLCNGY